MYVSWSRCLCRGDSVDVGVRRPCRGVSVCVCVDCTVGVRVVESVSWYLCLCLCRVWYLCLCRGVARATNIARCGGRALGRSGLQIVDQGVILHRCSYLRDFWNVMDALVVVCAAVQATFDLTSVVVMAQRHWPLGPRPGHAARVALGSCRIGPPRVGLAGQQSSRRSDTAQIVAALA